MSRFSTKITKKARTRLLSVLGLKSNASFDQVSKAWKRLSLKAHPDKGGSHAKQLEVNYAHEALTDEDATLRKEDDATKPSQPAPSSSRSAAYQQPTAKECDDGDDDDEADPDYNPADDFANSAGDSVEDEDLEGFDDDFGYGDLEETGGSYYVRMGNGREIPWKEHQRICGCDCSGLKTKCTMASRLCADEETESDEEPPTKKRKWSRKSTDSSERSSAKVKSARVEKRGRKTSNAQVSKREAAKEKAAKEKAARREKAAREQAEREQAEREQAEREQAEKEMAAQEKAAEEQAAQAGSARDAVRKIARKAEKRAVEKAARKEARKAKKKAARKAMRKAKKESTLGSDADEDSDCAVIGHKTVDGSQSHGFTW